MKIALFSDIHANLPAFEAMVADLESHQIDAVYCLGDLIGYNVWPNEIITEIRRRGIAALAGNHDLKVKNLATAKSDLIEQGKNYAYHIVSVENRNYLTTLPMFIRLEFQMNSDKLNIVLAHGSTRSVDEYVLEDLDETYLLEMMNEANADILCIGHTHKPYHRIIHTNDQKFKHIINIGSVGKPKDNNPKGCYVLMNLDKNTSMIDKETLQVEFIRVAYDVEKAAKGVEESPLPNEFADMLRKGY